MEQVMSNPSAMDIGTEGATPGGMAMGQVIGTPIIALDGQANFNPSPYPQEHGDIYKI
jgi:hypothetical protein